jgi:glycerophosphoryl diester phosphodiesterase
MERIKVFGHRGASAYRPENTMAAFELAYSMGADAIECDIVPTKDGRLVIRHEPELTETTDIAKFPEFEGRHLSNLLDFDELQKLRAIERLPDWRPGSAKFDGQFPIPTLDELLAADFLTGKSIILEVKHGPLFAELGIDVVSLFAKVVEQSQIVDRCEVIVEAFEYETLVALRECLGSRYTYIYLMEEWDEAHAFEFDGISLDFALIRRRPELVTLAHEHSQPVYAWTARAEEAETSVEEYFHGLISTGVDGIFADHPDLLLNFVEGLT